jgi:hypothetical protein
VGIFSQILNRSGKFAEMPTSVFFKNQTGILYKRKIIENAQRPIFQKSNRNLIGILNDWQKNLSYQ